MQKLCKVYILTFWLFLRSANTFRPYRSGWGTIRPDRGSRRDRGWGLKFKLQRHKPSMSSNSVFRSGRIPTLAFGIAVWLSTGTPIVGGCLVARIPGVGGYTALQP